jgi:UDP-glucuronate 4-epimerase
MSVLVTGAAGFIGSHLTDRLLENGVEVVGVDNYDNFYDPAVKERNLERARDFRAFTEIRGDLRDATLIQKLPAHIDTVVHLAARAGVRPSIADPGLYLDVNLQATLNVLELMRSRGLKRLLFGSSSSVYGDSTRVPFCETDCADRPISPYAATKRAGELLVHAYHHLHGVGSICLRFFTVYGPRQRPDLAIHKFAALLHAGEPIPMFGDGSSERDYTYVGDILDGIEGALRYLDRHTGCYEIVNLGSARTISLRRMIEVLAGELDVEARVRQLPDRSGDVRTTFADLSRAKRLLGYTPAVSFDQGMRRFAEWFQAARASAPALVGS